MKTDLSTRECIALDMYHAFFSFLHTDLLKIAFDSFDSALIQTKKN